MKPYSMDRLLLIGEEQAEKRYLDEINYRWLMRCLIGVLGYCLVNLSLGFEGLGFKKLFLPLFTSIFCVAIYSLRHSAFMERYVRPITIATLWVLMFLLTAASGSDIPQTWVLIALYVILVFRFGFLGTMALYASFWYLAFWLSISNHESVMVVETIVTVICATISYLYTNHRRKGFLKQWRKTFDLKERKRMKNELEHARDIQLSLLPPGSPTIEGLDLACCSLPATEVGGDYYDYFPLGERKTALIIGDVSGHGVASGLVLSGVRSCLYLLRDALPKPEELLTRLNRMLKLTTDKKMFMTFLYLELDTEAGEVCYANAGHQPMMLCRPGGEPALIHQKALPLGGILAASYRSDRLAVQSGDVLVLHSDGLIELSDYHGKVYGMKRFTNLVQRLVDRKLSSDIMLEAILQDARDFRKEAEQDDDITLVVARIK